MKALKCCVTCQKVKPINEFYVSKSHADGYKNECVDCFKKRMLGIYYSNANSEDFLKSERERCRLRYKRLDYKSRGYMSTYETDVASSGARRMAKKLGVAIPKGYEIHHWDYNQPYSFFLFSKSEHHYLHHHIRVDYNDKHTYTLCGRMLATQEDADNYFRAVLDERGKEYRYAFIDLLKNERYGDI